MGKFINVLRGLSALLSVIGGAMSLGSSFFSLNPNWILTDEQTQQLGFSLFVISVILLTVVAFVDGLLIDATKPRLVLGLIDTKYKPVHRQWQIKDLKLTDPNIHSELEFAFLDVINNPKNRTNGKTAEKTHARLTFHPKTESEKIIKHARWLDEETPLFQPLGDIQSLKTVDIYPGEDNPVSLVVAFKRKHSNDVYAFYFTDHQRLSPKVQLDELLKERFLGKPPIKMELKLDGNFGPKTFDLIIDIDQKGNFVINENKK